MALIQDFETPSGAVARYWRVVSVDARPPTTISVTLDGFVSEAARHDGKRPAHSVSFDMPFKDSLTVGQVYDAARAAYVEGRSLFADAKSA